MGAPCLASQTWVLLPPHPTTGAFLTACLTLSKNAKSSPSTWTKSSPTPSENTSPATTATSPTTTPPPSPSTTSRAAASGKSPPPTATPPSTTTSAKTTSSVSSRSCPTPQRVLERLQSRYEIFIASAAMEVPTSFVAKYDWLAEHFPFIPTSHIVFCGDKSILRADYLCILDDSNPRQLKLFQETQTRTVRSPAKASSTPPRPTSTSTPTAA